MSFVFTPAEREARLEHYGRLSNADLAKKRANIITELCRLQASVAIIDEVRDSRTALDDTPAIRSGGPYDGSRRMTNVVDLRRFAAPNASAANDPGADTNGIGLSAPGLVSRNGIHTGDFSK